MEDLAVLDLLLQCPLCTKPLDGSAKVLPCQHTFCKTCLQQHEATVPQQMCCPECRAATPGSVEELPNNHLLVRLLDSLQDRGPLGTPRDRSRRYVSSADQEELLCGYIQDLHLQFPKEGQNTRAGDCITLIKQVDENWVEGQFGEKVGIFPLQFTEPNPAAHKLLEKRRRRDSVESHPRIGGWVNADARGHGRLSGPSYKSTRPPNVSLLNSLNYPPRSQSQRPPHFSSSAHSASNKTAHLGTFNKSHLRSSHGNLPKRDRKMNGESPPTITMALINPQTPLMPSESKMSATQQLSISVCAALYSYMPHHAEELELRKGEMVGVYGKFKEGWLRGLSLRTGKVGILPANYVTPVLRTSARFLEQTKPAVPNTSTVSTNRHTPHKPQAVVLALDKVNADAPSATMTVMSYAGAGRAPQMGGKQGWTTVRRSIHTSHRGLPHHGSYNSTSIQSLQPPPQDLGTIYTFGRSPVLPKRRNGLFSNPINTQHWTHEGTAPSGGGYQTGTRDPIQKEANNAPQSILVKPDAHKQNPEKFVKSVRFLDARITPQATSKMTPSGLGMSAGHNVPTSQHGISGLDHWNPSAILGRDGSTLVLKDSKTLPTRKSTGQDHTAMDFLSLNMKPVLINHQSSTNRYRVMKGYNAKTDAELTLTEGEIVIVQRPRPDGRVLVTQEISGKTGLFHYNILEIMDKVL